MSVDDGRFDVSNYEGRIHTHASRGASALRGCWRAAVRFYQPERTTQDLDVLVGPKAAFDLVLLTHRLGG